MKKVVLLSVVVLASCFLFNSSDQLTRVSAQKQTGPVKGNAVSTGGNDAEMARTVKKLTDRAAAGLTQKPVPGGGVEMNLDGRLQNVALGRIEDDGSIGAACVARLCRAHVFFFRGLQAGA